MVHGVPGSSQEVGRKVRTRGGDVRTEAGAGMTWSCEPRENPAEAGKGTAWSLPSSFRKEHGCSSPFSTTDLQNCQAVSVHYVKSLYLC